MRIISGSARGRKLFAPRNMDIRPTSDRAREALFSILANRIEHALIFDFYSGTGALGIEALSRGARGAIFFDNSRDAIETAQRNITLLPKEFQPTYVKLIKHDLSKSLPLRQLEILGFGPADIIFADPPYSKGLAELFLQQISTTKLLQPNGLLVIEERSNEELTQKTAQFTLKDKRVYGEAAFWMYTSKPITTAEKQTT